MHRVADCMIRRVIPQPTEWENIGNQIDAAMIFARADFVNMDRRLHRSWTFNHFVVAMWSAKDSESARGVNPQKAILFFLLT